MTYPTDKDLSSDPLLLNSHTSLEDLAKAGYEIKFASDGVHGLKKIILNEHGERIGAERTRRHECSECQREIPPGRDGRKCVECRKPKEVQL